MMMIAIREACEEDASAAAAVHAAAWRESYAGLLPEPTLTGLSVDKRESLWRSFVSRRKEGCRLFLALSEGDVVGFAAIGPARGSVLAASDEIYALYLLDRAKRQGLGRALMRRAVETLVRPAERSLGLWVFEENAPARRFYEALGGRPGPVQTFQMDGRDYREIAYLWPAAVALLRISDGRSPAP